MSVNSFGRQFKFSSFGESHGPAMGVIIDGCPAGVSFDEELLKFNLSRRRPGQSAVVTSRSEADEYEILSGVYQGKTLGTPIAVIIRNKDARSEDYEQLKQTPRQGHADDVWLNKFGHADPRGGGRASGRETVSRVVAGSVAQMFVRSQLSEARVIAFTQSIHNLEIPQADQDQLVASMDPINSIENSPVRMPSSVISEQAIALLAAAKAEGQSYGGRARVILRNIPEGLGQPVFAKFKADLANAVMSLGAVVGFELGEGFGSAEAIGTEFHTPENSQNSYGGIRGGITTGEPLYFNVAFKPTSSIMDVAKKGRHDPCIVPRAIPVLESMTYVVLADHILLSRMDRA